MKRIVLAVVLAAVAITALTSTASADRPTPEGHGKKGAVELSLPRGQHAVSTVIDTPIGKAIFSLEESVSPITGSATLAASTTTTTYYKTCKSKVTSLDGYAWRLQVTSTFWYNYSRVVSQNTPSVAASAIFPWSWSDRRAWNSYWSPTVRFADGAATLHSNVPWPNVVSVPWHVFIQEDAWGNCRAGAYRE